MLKNNQLYFEYVRTTFIQFNLDKYAKERTDCIIAIYNFKKNYNKGSSNEVNNKHVHGASQ